MEEGGEKSDYKVGNDLISLPVLFSLRLFCVELYPMGMLRWGQSAS